MAWCKESAVRRYRIGRARLITEMGGCCQFCLAMDYSRLEFHHLHERTWVTRHLSRWSRLVRYRQEFAAGQIVLACSLCNKKLGKPKANECANSI